MKLVDSDALKSVFTEKSTEAVCGAELCKAIISRIDDSPAVDAIPISWIEQYGEENWFDYGTQYNAITEMLKAWERENNDK